MTARIHPNLAAKAEQLSAWRRHIHAHPELAMEETVTAAFVAEQLRAHGVHVVTGIGGTGLVAVIEGREPGPAIGLRADMDALPMNDESGAPHSSLHGGKAHACGHDGHTASLMGAAVHLAEHRPLRGRVHCIFQPGEETGQGARSMLDDGLFERFPCDEIYAFHNMPLLPPGVAGMRVGATLAADADFDIVVKGMGGHAAAPHTVMDPVRAAARIVIELPAIVSAALAPAETASIGVGKFQAGTARNIIPAEARLSGIVRTLSAQATQTVIDKLKQICNGYGEAWGCSIEVNVQHAMAACVNAPQAVAVAASACAGVLGADNVRTDIDPYPFADDFALMLERTPGAYFFLGMEGTMCHHPKYDFDDALIPIAASIFARIVELKLGTPEG